MKLVKLAAATAIACVAAGAAQAADYGRMVAPQAEAAVVVRTTNLPLCNDPRVLAQIEDQLEYGVPNTMGRAVAVMEFSGLHERAYFPAIGDGTMERRYCQGNALVTGGDYKGGTTANYVYYVVENPMGFAGVGWRAEGCFLGYDVWRVYGANCQSLRRF